MLSIKPFSVPAYGVDKKTEARELQNIPTTSQLANGRARIHVGLSGRKERLNHQDAYKCSWAVLYGSLCVSL